jgi:hypothetical protein
MKTNLLKSLSVAVIGLSLLSGCGMISKMGHHSNKECVKKCKKDKHCKEKCHAKKEEAKSHKKN